MKQRKASSLVTNPSLCQRKDNRGVSIISLIITIIVIVIIAAVVIYTGFSRNIEETQVSKILTEFDEVESAIIVRGRMHHFNETLYQLEGMPCSTQPLVVNNVTYGEGYYRVTPNILEGLGVTSVVKEYLVNYDTGDVLVIEPYYLSGKEVYRKSDMVDTYTGEEVISEGEYDEKQGVNRPVVVSGMLPVIYNGSNWVVVSPDDEDWYDYSLTTGGGPQRYANVMLLDDTKLKGTDGTTYTNEQIRSMNLDDLVGMTVVSGSEGSMFVWIPRFTYKEEDGEKSIVYSHLTQDYTNDGYLKEPAFYFGEYTGADDDVNENSGYVAGGKELTGIWISKYEAGYVQEP